MEEKFYFGIPVQTLYVPLLYHGSRYSNLVGLLHDHYFRIVVFRRGNIFD